jgi:TRAP-type C4-dicarboxylate transport system permease small subunit
MKSFDRVDKVISLFERTLMVVAAVCLFAIMIIGTVDVAGRYGFNRPLTWAYDLIALYLMSGMFFFALSDTLRVNEHVSVDMLHSVMTPRQRHAALVIGYALVSVVFALMTWAALARMIVGYRDHDVVARGDVDWPTWIYLLFVTLGFAVTWMRIVFRFFGHGLSALTGRSVIPLPPISGT